MIMKNRRKLVVFISIAIVVLVVGMLVFTQFVLAGPVKLSDKLIGAWSAELALVGRPTGYALATFTSDGLVIEDEVGTGESSGHGIWVIDRKGQVQFTVVELLWSPADDSYTGKFVISQTMKWDAATDTWSGPSHVTIYDATGTAVFSDTVPAKFTRIKLAPAP
jgi:hypothetical protein